MRETHKRRGPDGPSRKRRREEVSRKAKALAMSVVLVVSQLLSLLGVGAQPALAATSDSVTIGDATPYSESTGMYNPGASGYNVYSHRFADTDGITMYCADYLYGTPQAGETFYGSEPGGLTLDYLLYYGFGGPGYDDATGIVGYTGEGAQAVTQLAVWAALDGGADKGGYNDRLYEARALYPAAEAFLAQASGASADAIYAGGSYMYGATPSSTGDLQRVIGFTLRVGGIELHKSSSNPGVSDASGCYDLAGATYYVFDNADCSGAAVAALVTDSDGNASVGDLRVGTYYVREDTPATGYALDTTVYEVSVPNGSNATLEVTDVPQNDPARMTVAKLDAETGEASAQGGASLAGAEFTLSYYDGYYDSVDGLPSSPTRSWVVSTNEKGVAYLRAENLINGDDFYMYAGWPTLPLGTVTIQETKAPKGYLLTDDSVRIQQVTSDGHLEAVNTFVAPEVPEQVVRGGVRVQKVDYDTGEAIPEGDASLAGTEFAITNESAAAVVVDSTTYQPGEVVKTIVADASGKAATATDSLPYGTYEVHESKAPEGYLVDSAWSVRFSVQNEGELVDLTTTPLPDPVMRGGVDVQKVDAETHEPVAAGAATLAGAEIEITNDSAQAVVVDSILYQPGDVVKTLVTDEAGAASAAADALPFGTYTARETKAPKGYLLNSEWSQTFSIREDAQVVDLTGSESVVADQVIRGDLSLVKADEDSQTRMSGVPFLVTSKTTGEAHVVVTDENGMLSTSSSWNSHAASTNANDDALGADGTVDASKLDASAGVWFSGHSDQTTTADDELGALPYDTYEVQELRASTNQGHRLVSTIVTVGRDGVDLDLGTFDDKEVAISTTLTDADGSKYVPASAELALTDSVSYENLKRGDEFTLKGEIHVVNADGTDGGVVSTAEATFTPELSSGSTTLDFTVDASELTGRTLVAYEYLYDGDDLLATHADITDEGQTVRVIDIHTTLTSDATSDHDVPEAADQALTDLVTISGLEPGKTYTTTGTLHLVKTDADGNKSDAGTLTDENGDPVCGQATFTADATEQVVPVSFVVDASKLGNKTIVAFESLRLDGVDIATHADVTDEGQTVTVPDVHTTATDKVDGDHELAEHADQTVTDQVKCSNLIVGKEYIIDGTLHVKSFDDEGNAVDEGVLTDADGNPVSATTTFTAESTEEIHDLEFTFDASLLGGKDVVAFEDLSRDNVTVATHSDISDVDQTTTVPTIQTTLTSDVTGAHEAQVSPDADGSFKTSLTDVVSYSNLTMGKTYVVEGTLHKVETAEDGTKSDAGVLTDADGNAVKAQASFTAEQSTGTVELTFAFDASELDGETVVAFESVSHEGIEVATHADVTDESQTVHFVVVHTTATDKADADHEVSAGPSQTVVDQVAYKNLIVGTEYTVSGTLHMVADDGSDAGVLTDADGNAVTASKTFVADKADGTVDVEFTFDASLLGGHKAVAFEDLSTGGKAVATHSDITDEGQTVTFVTPPTPSTPMPNTGQGAIAAVLVVAGLTAAAAAGIHLVRTKGREVPTQE